MGLTVTATTEYTGLIQCDAVGCTMALTGLKCIDAGRARGVVMGRVRNSDWLEQAGFWYCSSKCLEAANA